MFRAECVLRQKKLPTIHAGVAARRYKYILPSSLCSFKFSAQVLQLRTLQLLYMLCCWEFLLSFIGRLVHSLSTFFHSLNPFQLDFTTMKFSSAVSILLWGGIWGSRTSSLVVNAAQTTCSADLLIDDYSKYSSNTNSLGQWTSGKFSSKQNKWNDRSDRLQMMAPRQICKLPTTQFLLHRAVVVTSTPLLIARRQRAATTMLWSLHSKFLLVHLSPSSFRQRLHALLHHTAAIRMKSQVPLAASKRSMFRYQAFLEPTSMP
jgi:hypothetical protein